MGFNSVFKGLMHGCTTHIRMADELFRRLILHYFIIW